MKKIPFPDALLKPLAGKASFNEFGASFEIPLASFDLPDQGTIKTVILLDTIELPSIRIKELAGKKLKFPLNPDDGYIDASVYMGYHHHPIDVSEIEFGDCIGKSINAKFKTKIVFTFEGLAFDDDTEYDDLEWAFNIEVMFPQIKN
jgi:hypothetical protein